MNGLQQLAVAIDMALGDRVEAGHIGYLFEGDGAAFMDLKRGPKSV